MVVGSGVGVLLDTQGMGIFGTFVLILVLVGIHIYCNAQTDCERHRFCAEVCSQYHDTAVVEGSQCFCKDDSGIYDPSTRPRANKDTNRP